MRDPGGLTWARFRESRVYIQILLAVGLVTVAGLAARLPLAPAAKVRQALSWTVSYDYDLRAHATNTAAWARERGGWLPAATGLWSTEIGRVQAWAARLSPKASDTDTPTASGTLAMPVSGGVLYGFGWLPPAVSREVHYGLDLAARQGTAVVAMADGNVLRTTTDPVLGTLVEVDHGRLVALYAQLERVSVRQGMQVKRGQQLAVVGQPSGAERGRDSHLHLEVRPAGGKAQVDPAPYLGLGGSKP
ncbi:MAG: peptidoglycan DD-metalloendopeptidase family protein [Mycobacterium leprae]